MINYGGEELHEKIHKVMIKILGVEKTPKEWKTGTNRYQYQKKEICQTIRTIEISQF